MIQILRIFLADMRRLRSNVVAIVVIMGLCVIPALYAWFNILSNWDPYGESATSQMQIAVYSEDAGVEVESLSLHVGDEVVSGLKENSTIGWVFTDSKEEALEGVQSGAYYAALLIPEDFTQAMISFLGGDPVNPTIDYYENSKKNAIATKITSKAKTAVQEQINESFIGTLAEVLTESGKLLTQADENGVNLLDATIEKLGEMNGNLKTYEDILGTFSLVTVSASDLAESAQSLLLNTQELIGNEEDSVGGMQKSVLAGATTADTVSSLVDVSLDSVEQDLEVAETQLTGLAVGDRVTEIRNRVKTAKETVTSTIAVIKDLIGETNSRIKAVETSAETLEKDLKTLTSDSVATAKSLKRLKNTLLSDIRDCKKSIRTIRTEFRTDIDPDISQTILDIENALVESGQLLNNLEDSFGDIGNALEAYQTTLDAGTDNISATKTYIADIRANLKTLIDRLTALSENAQYNEIIEMLQNDPQLIASFISSPAAMETEALYPIANYGSAMAPFYTVLAIWVGALILVALIHVHVKREEAFSDIRPWQAFFGRYLTFFLIGQVQTAFIVLGDLFYVEIQCPHPLLFYLAAAASSLVFTLFIYSLTVAMGNVGEAIAVIVMVLQVAGAGGTFPIEVLPEIYRRVYAYLPFTYCMNALRECVGGLYGSDYAKDLRTLGLYVLLSLFIGLVVAVPLRSLNSRIERSKAKSKIMI